MNSGRRRNGATKPGREALQWPPANSSSMSAMSDKRSLFIVKPIANSRSRHLAAKSCAHARTGFTGICSGKVWKMSGFT
jgi:hypothetical protein